MTTDAARALDRRLIALTVPALFTLAAEPIYVLADTAIVGHLGTGSLAGLGLASVVLTMAAGLCNVLTWGTTSRVGFLRGAGDDEGIGRVAASVLWLALVLGGVMALLIIGAAPTIVRALGGHDLVLHRAVTYLRIGSLGLPALLLAWAGQGVARGEGDTRGPLAVVIAANVLNIVLEVWFVYGMHWGIAGSAWGTVVAQWSGALVFAVRLLRRSGGNVRPDRAELRGLARVSTTLVVRTGALFVALTSASAVAARIDATALAAHQVIAQLNLFTALLLDAAAIAAQALIAEASGARDDARRALVIRRATRLTAIGSAALCVGLLGGWRALPAIFSDDRHVVDAVAAVMPILALMQFPGGAAYLLDGIVMGQGDFTTAMWSTLAGAVAFAVPAVVVLAHPSYGLRVLWLGLAAWLVARAIVNATGLRSNRARLVA
jgi:putative MATE family efflux protein